MKRALWLKGISVKAKGDEPGGHPGEVLEIPIDSILFSPFQPRGDIGSDLSELCESIKEHGVIQPVIVRKSGAGYELVAGERRVRACKMAGIQKIPAIVRDYDDQASAVAAIVENVQRAGLHPLDEAEAYRRLASEFHLTQEQVARVVGLSQPAVANKIRLLKLPERVKSAMRSAAITERHGRALLRLEGPEAQGRALDVILKKGLSVEETEALVEDMISGVGGRGKAAAQRRLKLKVGVFKDVRLFVNSFRTAVSSLRRAGISATLEEKETDTEFEMTMRIPKTVAGGHGGQRRSEHG